MSRTLDALQVWMSSNRLRLNPAKTQLIWFGMPQQLSKIDLASLALKYPHFTFLTTVRNLGVTFDQELTFTQDINLLWRSCYYQLLHPKVISRSLTPSAASTLVHAFVVSRLDYCGTLYHGLPACRTGFLNRVLRTAARLVGRISKFGHVSEYMRDELHWLPYPHRIAYRVSALVRRCTEGLAPPYLREFCCSTMQVQRCRCLRSAAQAELIVPARGLPLGCAMPFLLLALQPGMGFLSLSARYWLIAPSPSSLPSRPLCLTEAGLGALLSRQS